MKFLVSLLVCLSLVSCATLNLPDDASQRQKYEAYCKDAQMGYTLSVVMLDSIVNDTNAKVYWEAYKRGAATAIKTYCTFE